MKYLSIKAGWMTLVSDLCVAVFLRLLLVSGNAAEPDTESQTEKLAKETQDPVAKLISVPFQNNFNFGIGPTTQHSGF